MISLVENKKIELERLNELSKKPSLFEPGDYELWTDEHISKHMLEYHLDPDEEMASRALDTIRRSCEWLVSELELDTGAKVIDLGCGPGLYCKELSDLGLSVTGVDFSKRSIKYARKQQQGDIDYIHGDYLSVDISGEFDAALMIYYDFDVLSDEERIKMLDRIRSLLKKGGYFVFDVLTPSHPEADQETSRWRVKQDGGFWSPSAYLELSQRFYYPEEQVKLDQYIIIGEHGKTRIFRVWHKHFTLTQITKLLKRYGFKVESFYSDLTGKPYEKGSESIGIVARKT